MYKSFVITENNDERTIFLSRKFSERELTMLTDFYELTMANGYFLGGFQDTTCYFDMFFRRVPDNGGFAIMAGRLSERSAFYGRGRGISPVPKHFQQRVS